MKSLFERMADMARQRPNPIPSRTSLYHERRTFCPEDGRACYTPEEDEPKGFKCRNADICRTSKEK